MLGLILIVSRVDNELTMLFRFYLFLISSQSTVLSSEIYEAPTERQSLRYPVS